jgi:hypothetical protein
MIYVRAGRISRTFKRCPLGHYVGPKILRTNIDKTKNITNTNRIPLSVSVLFLIKSRTKLSTDREAHEPCRRSSVESDVFNLNYINIPVHQSVPEYNFVSAWKNRYVKLFNKIRKNFKLYEHFFDTIWTPKLV